MTREEAITIIDNLHLIGCGRNQHEDDLKINVALNMAIEALKEPKTIIGIDIPYGSDKGIATIFKGKDEKMVLEEVKEIMSVVRCKDCKYIDCCTRTVGLTRHFDGFREYRSEIIDFCSYGERKEP